MWISKSEYSKLNELEKRLRQKTKELFEANIALDGLKLANDSLNSEVKRLSELITAKNEDCKVGPWCRDCKHSGVDYAYHYTPVRGRYSALDNGYVRFCKKHIHELCQEWEGHGEDRK